MSARSKFAGLTARIALVCALLLAVSLVATDTVAIPGVAVAKNGKGGDSGKGPGKGEDKGKGHGNDKPKKTPANKAHENKGKDGENEDQPVVIVQAPNTTPVAVTPAPTATVVAVAQVGKLVVNVRECGATPIAGNDWAAGCAAPVPNARFDLTARSGPLSGWSHGLTADAAGVATLAQLPPGLYDLNRVAGGWCHAESDRVDASGNVVIAGGQTSTVWIYVCASPPASS
jgi:hypothetical protein